MEQWKLDAKRMRFEENRPINAITEHVHDKYFPDVATHLLKDRIRSVIKRSPEYVKSKGITAAPEKSDEKILSSLSIKKTPQQHAESLGLPIMGFARRVDRLSSEGYNIREGNGLLWLEKETVQNMEPTTLDVDWDGKRLVRFALIGDTHINSKYTQLTYLHDFYRECERQGIRHVYHAGDIDEGGADASRPPV